MNSAKNFPTIRGRTIGIFALTAVQFLIGSIHVFFGLWLISATATFASFMQTTQIYNVYTLTFGVLVILFTYGIWIGKSWGWIGTVATSLFVTVVDALTLLNLPSIPGIPKFAAGTEIGYSVLILLYLSQKHVRTKFKN
jgi:uncharacterized membrane protein (DUF2068 family)